MKADSHTTDQRLLELRGVHAAYAKKEVLSGVDLTIDRGETVALLGGNGAGKSTLLKTIAGILTPRCGSVAFLGADISTRPVHARQRLGIGILLQGARVFQSLTVAENLELAARQTPIPRSSTHASRLDDLFPALRERSGQRAGLLSGGQRQMLAIKMVLLQQPRLLLLDEPTNSLSPDLSEAILGYTSEYAAREGGGTLIVLHSFADASAIADRVIYLTEGKIAGPPPSVVVCQSQNSEAESK